MATKPQNRKAIRSLITMLVISLAMIATMVAGKLWYDGDYTPKLGLDLEGGQQVILKPVVREGESVSPEQLERAVDIMRNRVDGQGVGESEVATLGDQITVTVPGRMTTAQLDALRQSSQMRFRPALTAVAGTPIAAPSGSATGSASPSPSATPRASSTASTAPAPSPSGSASTAAMGPSSAPTLAEAAGLGVGARRAAVGPLPAATATPTPSNLASGIAPATATPSNQASGITPASATPSGSATPSASASGASPVPALTGADATNPVKQAQYATDQRWLTPAYQAQLAAYNCAKRPASGSDDLTKPVVACSEDGTVKYLLGPAILVGNDVTDANSAAETSQANGQPTGQWIVQLKIAGDAAPKYREISKIMLPLAEPRNQLAVVLDNEVITAPRFDGVIPGGEAQISGNFTQESSKLLADQLKFGALPMSFEFSSDQNISPTLGTDSLVKGLIAGAIGLLLVVIYSLFQYRALGLVTIASLIIVSALTYVMLAILGWSSGLRLTMAGITGAIVAIGTTADSFIVYFERVRDEVREGRRLQAAVETGWARAKRTILISDAVNFLAAGVLYVLASSNVRGFAFMLMLTTILDVIVVFLFTHPLLTWLASTKFFGEGHKWSGFDPEHLGTKVRYAGAGRVTVADRKRAGATGATVATAGTASTEGGQA